MTSPVPLQASALLAALRRERVTHLVGLPDNGSAPLFDLLAGPGDVRLVRVAREGEAFAVAAGLWLGGALPVVAIQNTGLLESGDALRGTAARMGVPLVVLVGFRGFARLESGGREPGDGPPSRAELTDPALDSAALMTEPTLSAWGVPFARVGGEADLHRVEEAFVRARGEERPVALLLTRELAC